MTKPAFPVPSPATSRGMTHHEYLVAHAPITPSLVNSIWGEDNPDLSSDQARVCYFAVWALLAHEWADAMIAHAKESA